MKCQLKMLLDSQKSYKDKAYVSFAIDTGPDPNIW